MDESVTSLSDETYRNVLLNRLQMDPNELQNFDPIIPQLLKKYIMYAKRTCEPVMGDEAAEVLRNFYIELRQTNLRSNGSNPVTMRQLGSLARLTQARAKVELRSTCSKRDALDVIEIMKASMVDYYENELSLLDFTQNSQNSSRSSTSSTVKQFVTVMSNIANQKKDYMFSFDEIDALYKKSNMKIKKANTTREFIYLLNKEGFLLKQGSDRYKLNATDFI